MARSTISSPARRAMMAQETSEVFLELITITEASLTSPIYITNNGEEIVSNSNTFVQCPFSLEAPADEEDFITELSIAVENVTRVLVPIVRSAIHEIYLKYQIVLASSPNTIELELEDFEIQSVDYDANILNAKFGQQGFLTQEFPSNKFTPGRWAGLS